MKKCVLTGALLAGLAAQAESVMPTAMLREDIIVPMALLDVENGNKIVGEVRISYNNYGALFQAEIEGLPQGIYGFHVHENPSCEAAEKDGKMVAGLAAGGHWDPQNTGAHLGPWNNGGHLGDLPALAVDAEGKVQPVLAPRIEDIADLYGRSLMIHAGGDNYSDHPVPLGGGGARKYCGVIAEPTAKSE